MDPLSVASSVVGLSSAGAQLIPMLYNLSSAIKDAPQQAQAAVSELGDITIVLTQLQKYIDGRAQASIQRLNLITVEHITATLTDCVMTYSELDALLKSLHVDTGLKTWDRAVWFVKKDDVALLIGRLQNHKSTFGLMLNIIQCASMNEAEKSMDRLCDMVNDVLKSNQRLSLRLRNMENIISKQDLASEPKASSVEEATPGADNESRHSSLSNSIQNSGSPASINSGGHIHGSPRISADLGDTRPKVSAFEELLHRSRVYRHAAGRHSQSSLLDDGRSTLAISICSSLTLGDVSKISVYALPVYADEISNAECYNCVQLDRSSSDSVSQASKSQEPKTPKREPKSLLNWWKDYRRTSQTPSAQQSAPKPIFGVELEKSIRYANVAISLFDDNGQSYIYGYLPIVVAKCGGFLKEKATEEKNVFQTAGSPKHLLALQVIFDYPPRYGKGFDWTAYTVWDAGSLLLRYLLQLPEPVIPHSFYERFREPGK